MSKELKALERIENKTIRITFGKDVVYYRYGDYLSKEDLVIIEKSLKALEIIKEKEVDICGIKNSIDVYDYNAGIENEDNFENRLLTQEEYDLLKEVLL